MSICTIIFNTFINPTQAHTATNINEYIKY
jgi:hypothetical protein